MKFLNESPATIITPLLRYALIALAGGLISKGYITAEQIDVVAGALVSLGTVVWMTLVKKSQKEG